MHRRDDCIYFQWHCFVKVTPEEVYPGDHKQCVCYSIEVFGRNCRPCTKSVTSEFEIRGMIRYGFIN